MDAATISLLVLVTAITLSCTTRIHVGFLSIAGAWIVGVFVAGLTPNQVIAGFPTALFITMAGVTLLFSQAQANGTLDRIAHRAVFYCRGNVGVMPIMFFLLAFSLSSIGPGNIASTAIIAPTAMAVAGQVGIPAFLMSIMVANGANAGALSPIAPTGVIVNGLMANMGLGGYELHTYLNNFTAHVVVTFAGYFLLGGWRLLGRRSTVRLVMPAGSAVALAGGGTRDVGAPPVPCSDEAPPAIERFERQHGITLLTIGALLTGIIFFNVNVGLGAFAGAMVLTLLRAGDERKAIGMMPWSVIMMVCGVTMLIGVLEKTGGLDLFTRLLVGVSTRESVTAVLGFTTAFISIYSSTSGVVLPALLPTVPGLAAQLGADPISIASSMNVSGHLVDVSPLSTLGALCMAAAPASEDPRLLFNKLMAWGLSMTVVGAAVCYLLFGVLRIGS